MNFVFNKDLLVNCYNDANENGIKPASRNLLRQLNIDINYNFKIDNTRPTLVISNHISILDLFILRAICVKDEIHIIVLDIWIEVLKALKKEILPVYLSYKPADSLLDKIRNRLYTFLEHNISRDEATRLNKQAISQASDIINNGGSAVIFPGGGKLDNLSDWESGVGYIINQLDNNDAQVIFVNIENTYRADMIKLTRLNLFNKHRLVDVTVSEPISVANIQDKNITGKEMTQKLKEMYEKI